MHHCKELKTFKEDTQQSRPIVVRSVNKCRRNRVIMMTFLTTMKQTEIIYYSINSINQRWTTDDNTYAEQ